VSISATAGAEEAAGEGTLIGSLAVPLADALTGTLADTLASPLAEALAVPLADALGAAAALGVTTVLTEPSCLSVRDTDFSIRIVLVGDNNRFLLGGIFGCRTFNPTDLTSAADLTTGREAM